MTSTKIEQKKRKIPFRKVIKDTAFAFKITFKIAPFTCIFSIFVWMFDSFANFITNTYALRYIVDSYENGISFEAVAKTVIFMIVIPAAIGLITNVITDYLWSIANVKVDRKVCTDMFKKNMGVELACYETPEFYDKFVKGSTDTASNMLNVTYQILYMVYLLSNSVLFGGLLFTMDPVFIVFAIIPLFGAIFKRKSNELWHKHTSEDRIAHRRCEYVQRVFYSNDYAKEMRLTNSKNFMLKRYDVASDERMDIVKRYGKMEMLLNILGNKISSILANPLAIAYAVFRTLISHTLGMSDCVVVINSVSELSNSFVQISGQYFFLHEKALFTEDYLEFMEYEPKMRDSESSIEAKKGTIRFENVSFKYEGSDKYVLKNINLEIKDNEKIALVGHNGAGKSTLIKLLLRLYDTSEGKITVDGVDIKNFKIKDYRDMFSVVFQDFKMVAMPVLENVLMRPQQDGDREKVIDALKKSGVYDKICTLPEGIDTVLTKEFDENGAVLSVGESQKIAIARAFVHPSPYIVLDEPSSALDPIAEAKMYSNMMEIGEGKGMVFISHRLSSAVSADKIYLFENGEIIEHGTHTELMHQNGKYADMFKKQAQNYVDLAESEVSI